MSSLGRWQRVLLVFALLLGVVAMHAMVLTPVGGDEAAADRAVHVTAEPEAHPMAAMVVEAVPGAPGPAEVDGPPPAVHDTAHQDPAPHSGTGSAPAMHDLLHLCLAVLVALAMLVVALAVVRMTAAAATLPRGDAADGDTAPARPPPRSAVRLALLCVLRN